MKCLTNDDVVSHLWERECYCNVNMVVQELIDLAQAAGHPRDSELDEETVRDLSVAPSSLEDICYENDIHVKEIPNGSFVAWRSERRGKECDLEPYGKEPPSSINLKEVSGYWVKWADGDLEPYGDEPPDGAIVAEHGNEWIVASDGGSVATKHGFPTCEDAVRGAWDQEEPMMYATREEAVEAAWDDESLDEYDDEEEAMTEALDAWGIDRYEYDREVYEHYAVSGFLADKLEEQGEHVVHICRLHIWCRCCTGQSVTLDGVLQAIASKMEILKGQANSWVDDAT